MQKGLKYYLSPFFLLSGAPPAEAGGSLNNAALDSRLVIDSPFASQRKGTTIGLRVNDSKRDATTTGLSISSASLAPDVIERCRAMSGEPGGLQVAGLHCTRLQENVFSWEK